LIRLKISVTDAAMVVSGKVIRVGGLRSDGASRK